MRYVAHQHATDRRQHLSVGGALAIGVLAGGAISVLVMCMTAFLLRMLS